MVYTLFIHVKRGGVDESAEPSSVQGGGGSGLDQFLHQAFVELMPAALRDRLGRFLDLLRSVAQKVKGQAEFPTLRVVDDLLARSGDRREFAELDMLRIGLDRVEPALESGERAAASESQLEFL